MKANEFVKKFGWEISIDVSKTIQKSSWVDVRVGGWWSREFVELPELKRLVESHELANRLGGVDTMRIMIEQMEINDLCDGMNISFDGEWQGVFTKGQLQQAIADVEACQ